MPLQADAEKEVWVDPQDAFHNYRLLTAARECFVVSCAWRTSMMLDVLKGDSGAETEHLMPKYLLRCTALFPPVSSTRPWLLSVQLVQGIISNSSFVCSLLQNASLLWRVALPS